MKKALRLAEENNAKIEKLSDDLLYLPDARAVRMLDGKYHSPEADRREVRALLEPFQRALPGELLSGGFVEPPARMRAAFEQDPFGCLVNVRPVTLADPPSSVENWVQVNFVYESVAYVGWQTPGTVQGLYGCALEDDLSRWASRIPLVGIDPHMEQLSAGTFTMGSSVDDPESTKFERPQHRVVISRPFLIQSAPVTQAEWEHEMGYNPARFRGSENPVETVSWFDAIAYCNALSRARGLEQAYILSRSRGRPGEEGFTAEVSWKGLSCPGFRLPTEAEWEYACRAGTTRLRDAEIDSVAWYCVNSEETTHPVRQKNPNAWGLFDMLGNVSEWTWDWHRVYPRGTIIDPVGAEVPSTESLDRVGRGGSWDDDAFFMRAASRNSDLPINRFDFTGFRVVRTLYT